MQAKGIRLIVSADDVGVRPSVNEATFTLLESGAISSASLMANGPAFEQAASQIKNSRHRSIGAHLNCTSYEPLCTNRAIRPLLGEDGEFHASLFRQVSPTPALLLGLLEEFSLQIRRIEQSGISISHIDSHHHVHTKPALFPVLKCLQYRHRIRRARIAWNIFVDNERSSPKQLFKKRTYNHFLRTIYATKSVDYFGSFADFLRDERIPAKSCVVEAMVHLGSEPPSLYHDEENLLKTNWQESYPVPIEMIGYHQL